MKIHALCDLKLMISDYYNQDISHIDRYILHNQRIMPHVLFPNKISLKNNLLFLHYDVSERGCTLRKFIQKVSEKKSFRETFIRQNNIHPFDVILQLIDGIGQMLKQNSFSGNSYLNPDYIWVDYDMHGKIVISIIDVLETIIGEHFRIENENKHYWSIEYIKQYKSTLYHNIDSIVRKPTFARLDTIQSSFSLVYSLGLILYFVYNHCDPYDNDNRTFPEDRTILIGRMKNLTISRVIWMATEPDVRNRPNLTEFKSLINETRRRRISPNCVII